jgi:transcription elongation factor GreA
MVKTIYLTADALTTLKGELKFLQKEKRTEVSERIKRAREMGDLSENAEYEAALDEQALLENRIVYLEDTLRSAKVIKNGDKIQNEVVIGSTVVVDIGGKKDEFLIVGRVEANPLKKKISNESPMGKVLIGSKIGEIKEVKTPTVSYSVKVLEIK